MAAGVSASKRLFRRSSNKLVFGICGGLAKYWRLNPTLVRFGWILGTALTGLVFGVVVYLVMALLVPVE